MRPNETLLAQPIRSLQTMLRVISEADEVQPSVVPDGIYGNDTVAAVTAFQRRNNLPATGITDQDTWNAIVPQYQSALVEIMEAEPLQIILDPGEVIRRDQSHPNVYILQAVLTVLSRQYSTIPLPGFSGVLDLATSEAISAFQELSLLPVTGELDKMTWKHLALQYPLAANPVAGDYK